MGPPLVARPQDRSSLPPQERLLCVAEPPRGADRMPREEQGGQSLVPTPIEGRACGLPGETVAAMSPSAFGDPLEEVEEEPAVTRPRVAIDGWVETELELPAHEPMVSPEPRSAPTRGAVQAEPVFGAERLARISLTVEPCDAPAEPRWGLSPRGEVRQLHPATTPQDIPGWSSSTPPPTSSAESPGWRERFEREFADIARLECRPPPRAIESHRVPNVGVGEHDGETVVMVNPTWMQLACDEICGGDEDCRRDLVRGIAGHEWGHLRGEAPAEVSGESSHERELRADRTAGRILRELGGSAEPLLELLSHGAEHAGDTHPGRAQRQEAVLAGNEHACCQGIGDCTCEDQPRPDV